MSETVTVLDILRKIDTATDRMGNKNPHKYLLKQCGAAIIELARKAHGLPVEHLATPEQVAAQ